MESSILIFVQEHIRNEFLDPIMIFMSKIGNMGMIWIVISTLLICNKKTRKIGIMSILSLVICFAINNLAIKNLVQRPRPYTEIKDLKILVDKPTDYSFPSGHTCSSFAVAGICYRFMKKKGIIFVVLAVLISLSRLYVGVHYPTDILGGAFIGILFSGIVFKMDELNNYNLK